MDEIIRIHTIGYSLQDVKVLFNHDLKIELSDIHVSGNHGEILVIPRWIANILESNKHVEIQDSSIIDELKQSIVKENSQDEFNLSTLDYYFYIKVKSYMKRLSSNDHDKTESLLKSLFRKRQGKIIRLADSSRLTNVIAQKLTIEEREFYNQIHRNSINFKKQIFDNL